MPTSDKTNQKIIQILDKHLTKEKQIDLFKDLSGVPGNSSFITSIKSLLKLIIENSYRK